MRSTVALALVVSSLLVAGAVGPVVAAGAPIDADGTETSALDCASDESDAEPVFDDPDDLEAFVDDAIADRRAEHEIPGATVSVVEGDETVLAKGYGEADAEAGTPVRANETAFMVGSVAKLVTWTAVMQAVEDGELDLDEDVNAYLEDSEVEVPDTYDEPVTLRHLGTHTAGFDIALSPGLVEDGDDVTALETALVEDQPDRVRPPGETTSYSNYGTMLAGHVVEETYDTSFEAYVQSDVFGPLEMDHSTFAQPVPDDHPGELAAPHAADGESEDRWYINWRPAGSMSATATDMASFMRAHLDDGAVDDARILEPETVATMHDTHHERHPELTDWRYGFYEYGATDADLLAHSGGTMHEASKLVLAPEDDVGIFVSYNLRDDAAPPGDVVDEILEAYELQPEPESDADVLEGATPDEAGERADAVAGEYRTTMAPTDGPEQVVDLAMRFSVEATGDGRLESDTLGFNEQEWVETEPYVYHEVGGHDVLVADVVDGEVESLHASSAPMLAYEPVAAHERTLVVGSSVGVAVLGFALSVLGWIGFATWRRVQAWRTGHEPSEEELGTTSDDPARGSLRERLSDRLRHPPWLARAPGTALCVVSLAFVGSFLWGLGVDGEFAFATVPTPFRFALALPPLVGALALATAIGSVLAWQRGYWSRRARIHQTVLTGLGLAFVWFLVQFGFLGV
ncbi:serine hydrolase domain-containing protein [Natronorubrum texcoconense]|uniref:CubicO group peptidase, beta-lactamase class C family n=1 Tax=Natronorubrum texcoconense TaxID=1095776 RepID=A0A1G9BV01_9EURY|nr:serine hydrolase domain-containing protein [Natronorubrum texcoconense]SDK43291.1 CubicO group peptidase, beta-lactamase class C family [Natronorubrum texcoconense]